MKERGREEGCEQAGGKQKEEKEIEASTKLSAPARLPLLALLPGREGRRRRRSSEGKEEGLLAGRAYNTILSFPIHTLTHKPTFLSFLHSFKHGVCWVGWGQRQSACVIITARSFKKVWKKIMTQE